MARIPQLGYQGKARTRRRVRKGTEVHKRNNTYHPDPHREEGSGMVANDAWSGITLYVDDKPLHKDPEDTEMGRFGALTPVIRFVLPVAVLALLVIALAIYGT